MVLGTDWQAGRPRSDFSNDAKIRRETRLSRAGHGKEFQYPDFAPKFTAEMFNADQWAEIFERAGAKYVVLVSKHHDGFALWPSREADASWGRRGMPSKSGHGAISSGAHGGCAPQETWKWASTTLYMSGSTRCGWRQY